MNAFVDIRMYVLPPDLRKPEYDEQSLIHLEYFKAITTWNKSGLVPEDFLVGTVVCLLWLTSKTLKGCLE